MVHIEQFLNRKESKRGLGYYSEQAFESVHANFKADWNSVKVDINHPQYLEKLLSCVNRWNARHI